MLRTAKYKVALTADERNELLSITREGKESARKVLFARTLLLLDQRP